MARAGAPLSRTVYLRQHQGQRCKSIDDVVADRFADLVFGARVVEHVIHDLKREPQLAAVLTQCIAFPFPESTEQRPDVAARRQQDRGLGFDAPHVLVYIRLVPIADRLLADLAGTDRHHGACEGVDHLGHATRGGILVCLGEVKVADHDRRLVPEPRRDRRPSTAGRRSVDDVVVNEGRGVRQLDSHGGRHQS